MKIKEAGMLVLGLLPDTIRIAVNGEFELFERSVKMVKQEMVRKVVLLVIGLAFVTTANAALITNPGFESGDWSPGWVAAAGASIVSDNGTSVAGSYAAEIGSGAGGDFRTDTPTYGIAVTAGETYDYSFDWRTVDLSSGWYTWHVRFWDAGNGFTGEAAGSIGDGEVQNTWFTLTGSIIAPAGSTYADFAFHDGKGEGSTGTFRIDNVSLVPEPMTLSLLGLGGLLLRRRK